MKISNLPVMNREDKAATAALYIDDLSLVEP